MVEKQYIYGIKAGDCIKIGITTDVSKRLQAINTCNHEHAELCFYAKHKRITSCALEMRMHNYLNKMGRNKKLEWFYCEGDEADILEGLLLERGPDFEFINYADESESERVKQILNNRIMAVCNG